MRFIVANAVILPAISLIRRERFFSFSRNSTLLPVVPTHEPMSTTAVRLNLAKVGRNDEGYEDVDAFWDASEVNTTARSSSSRNNNTLISDADQTLNYDDTGSIGRALAALLQCPPGN